ncbi:MAG: poly-gamma-glutamate biosynthesis protein PgsC [Candidatus Saccharicenans sp.]|jgi:poly-gamma-glutamate biosynthesis protein PgsC/CapC|nr:poly-gamma-glutamate biosynthesis protein PgsC [Candidatus Saccharicenans sp.]MDH7492443.1 poly-gamma-glutamate biosynthesis protein PgsC [Candidatus Saccharicenans sp.]
MLSEYSSLFLGLVLALIFTELAGFSPGGLIVPGYFAIYLDQPWRPLATLLVALVTLGLYRLAGSFLILFGRRRFVFMILTGVVLAQAWALILPRFFSEPLSLRVIGWVVPGLLASNLERQKTLPTLAALILVSVMTFFLVRLFF